jgi:hypothetical protein
MPVSYQIPTWNSGASSSPSITSFELQNHILKLENEIMRTTLLELKTILAEEPLTSQLFDIPGDSLTTVQLCEFVRKKARERLEKNG